MANTTVKILENTFGFHAEWFAPVTLPSWKPSFPSSWCCLDKLELSCAWLNATCTPDLTKFSLFSLSHSFYIASGGFLCVFLLLLAFRSYHSPTACWAGTAIPCKERRREKHSLIFLCTVTCMTFDHRQRLSHSWIGPKGRNNSRKTTLLTVSEASRTPESLLPHLQFIADLAKQGIQLQALWFK